MPINCELCSKNTGIEKGIHNIKKNININSTLFEDSDEESLIITLNNKAIENAEKKESGGGCYVATAVYGSYDCPEVWTLRRYRDNVLAESILGRAFIHTYYTISPIFVKRFGETQWFKNLFKDKLDKMVKILNKKGFEDTPYEDKNWKIQKVSKKLLTIKTKYDKLF